MSLTMSIGLATYFNQDVMDIPGQFRMVTGVRSLLQQLSQVI